MSTHSLFSPSSASRWMSCPGSMAFPENQQQDGGSNKYADDGTASHEWAALCLTCGLDPEFCGEDADAECFLDEQKIINGATYTMDETRASFIQMYLDDVRRRAIGGMLFVEFKIDLSEYLGEGQGGTADAVIYLPETKHLICEDLKYGKEQVDAKDNPQLLLYLLGVLKDIALMGYDVETVTGVICQPRLGHIDEHTISVKDLKAFGEKAKHAVRYASEAMIAPHGDMAYLSPGEKQCRWCRAKANCPALAKFTADAVRCDFETIQAGAAPVPPVDTISLSKSYQAVPLIELWCKAVAAEVAKRVTEGVEVFGPDDKPYKFVEGKQGYRVWADKAQAEAALLGQLGPEKAYEPLTVITAPAAAKLLDKKATKALWKDVFEPMIKKPPGKPVLALGSDPRPPYSGAATADDFDDQLTE